MTIQFRYILAFNSTVYHLAPTDLVLLEHVSHSGVKEWRKLEPVCGACVAARNSPNTYLGGYPTPLIVEQKPHDRKLCRSCQTALERWAAYGRVPDEVAARELQGLRPGWYAQYGRKELDALP